MAVLDIRGTHGSGKSYLVRQLLEFGHEEVHESNKHIGYYIPNLRCGVVGRYDVVCCGCDGIRSAKEVERRTRLFHSRYEHVVLEGLLVAHTFKRYNDLAADLTDYVFLFLDTPIDVCIQRVEQRRVAVGNHPTFDPVNLIRDHHVIMGRVAPKLVKEGRRVIMLDHNNPLPTVLSFLRRRNETPVRKSPTGVQPKPGIPGSPPITPYRSSSGTSSPRG